MSDQFSSAHAELDRAHTASRARLLASLADVEAVTLPRKALGWLRRGIARLTPRQRIAAGGFGLSTAVGLLLLILIVVNSATPLSAMERMIKQLRESWRKRATASRARTAGESNETTRTFGVPPPIGAEPPKW